MIEIVQNSDPPVETAPQQHTKQHINRIDRSCGGEILVISLTKGHLADRLSIAADLWTWGFPTDIQYEEINTSIVDALTAAQSRGFSIVVSVRTAYGSGIDLKVYNLITKSATEGQFAARLNMSLHCYKSCPLALKL